VNKYPDLKNALNNTNLALHKVAQDLASALAMANTQSAAPAGGPGPSGPPTMGGSAKRVRKGAGKRKAGKAITKKGKRKL
jgi:hypothetical protein